MADPPWLPFEYPVQPAHRQIPVGEALAARYLDGWFRQDPLLPRLLARPAGACEVVPLDAPAPGMGEDYWEIFFRQPMLGVGRGSRTWGR